MKNPKVKAAYMPTRVAEHPTEQETQQRTFSSMAAKRKQLTKLTDRLAGDEFFVTKWKMPKASEYFPTEWRMQHADLYYPYAVGGPLFIDQPTTTADIALCERKRQTLLKTEIRYIYVLGGQSENDVREAMGM